jgi:serine/threonine protein kinase
MPSKRFSLPTIINFGIQSLEALRKLHDEGFIHRDIKMGNFMIGRGSEGAKIIYLIDFGLIKRYLSRDGDLLPVCCFMLLC